MNYKSKINKLRVARNSALDLDAYIKNNKLDSLSNYYDVSDALFSVIVKLDKELVRLSNLTKKGVAK